MKKSLLIIAASALAFSWALTAAAEEATLELTVNGSTTPVKVNAKVRGEASTSRPILEKRDVLKAQIEAKKQELQDKREEVKDKREEVKEKMSEKREDIKELRAEVREKASDRLDLIVKNAGKRLSHALEELNSIKARIESRLTKFEQAGATTTSARADLSIAVSKLAIASTSVQAVLSTPISTSTPTTTAAALKTAVKTAQTAIQDAHKSLMQVIADMKGLQGTLMRDKEKRDRPATTTASTTRN